MLYQATLVFGIIFWLILFTFHIITSTFASRNAYRTAKAYRILWTRVEKLSESLSELNVALTTVIRFSEVNPYTLRDNGKDPEEEEDWSLPIDGSRFALEDEERVPGQ